MRGLKKALRALSVLADVLAVITFDWKTAVPAGLVTAALSLLAIMLGVNVFQIAVGIPIAAAAMLFVACLVKAWTVLGSARATLGVPPIMAIDLYTDPAFRERRNNAAAKQYELWGRVEIHARLLKQAARRNRQALRGASTTPEPTEEEVDLRERTAKLTHEKTLADLEHRAASHDVQVDFYGKLIRGKLIAHGYLLPMKAGTPPVDIPPAEWHALRFDEGLSHAKCHGIEYMVISVRET